jgi:hypothetical protein
MTVPSRDSDVTTSTSTQSHPAPSSRSAFSGSVHDHVLSVVVQCAPPQGPNVTGPGRYAKGTPPQVEHSRPTRRRVGGFGQRSCR